MTETASAEESQSSLASVTGGASLYFLGQVITNAIGFVFNFILTRGLGASMYGVFAYAMTIIQFTVIMSRAGTGKSLLKFIPANADNPRRRNFFLGLAYATALGGSVLAGAVLYIGAPFISSVTLDQPLLVKVLRVFALVLPFNTLIQLTNAVFRGLEEMQYQVAIENITKPLVRVVFVAVALYLGYSLMGVVAALALGIILICLVAISLLYTKTTLRPGLKSDNMREDTFAFYNYSLPLTLKDAGSILYRRVDILMVGFFLADTTVGIYRIVVLLATVLAMPLTAFNQLFPSIASRLYENDKLDELESVFETVTRWTVTLVVPPALVAGLYSGELLAIFGPEFSAGALVLALFTVGQLTNAAVGPSGYLLTMTEHQYMTMLNNWLLGVLNIIFNYLFILEFGVLGAALATAGVLSFVNILRVVEVWYYEGLHPYSRTLWKPVAAAVLAGGLMVALRTTVEGYTLLIGGSLAGGLAFVGLLVAFGIQQEDREFFRENVLSKF